jgi:hypothetical protein
MRPSPKRAAKTVSDPLPEEPTEESRIAIEESALNSVRAATQARVDSAKAFIAGQADQKFYAVLVFDTEAHCTDFLDAFKIADLMDGEWRRYLDGHKVAARLGKPLTRPRPNLKPSQSRAARWQKHVRR